MGDVVYTNVRELHRRLDAIDPALRKAMVKDAKLAAKPLQTGIKSAIPSIAPLSGFSNSGRLGYGVGKPAKSVSVNYRIGRSKFTAITSLLSVRVNSPAVVLMDMAGRSNRYIGAGYKGSGSTREYAYKGGTRKHRTDGNGVRRPSQGPKKYRSQGEALISNLGSRASRFAWPAAERALPAIQAQVKGILDRASSRISRTF